MALLPTSLDYTDKDFDSLRTRLINLIRSVFPTWTDHNVANFGNILMELTAFVGDVLGFYQDNQAAESRWTTAKQRENLIALAKLIGFKPEGAKAATTDVVVTARDASTGGPPVGNVTIPAGTLVYTAEITEPIVFQLLSDVSIAASADPSTDTVTAENSQTRDEQFASTGLANQEILLPEIPYLDDSAIIVADDGAYTEVENFLSSTASDRHFTVTVNSVDRALVRFGNGINGKIPIGQIQATYKIGGGSEGTIEEDTLTRIPGSFFDSLGNQLTVTVTNPDASSGAQPRQTVEQIRVAAPESIRVINRAVSREDFEISARAVEGVSRALMTTSNEDLSVPENSGNLYVIPEGGGVPSQALKDEVQARFAEDGETPATLTFEVTVKDPDYLTIDVRAIVFLVQGAELDPTKANYAGALIRADLESFFAISNEDGSKNTQIGFGFEYKNRLGVVESELPISTVRDVVKDSSVVRKLGDGISDFTLNGEAKDVEMEIREFPQLGTVTLIDGDTLLAL